MKHKYTMSHITLRQVCELATDLHKIRLDFWNERLTKIREIYESNNMLENSSEWKDLMELWFNSLNYLVASYNKNMKYLDTFISEYDMEYGKDASDGYNANDCYETLQNAMMHEYYKYCDEFNCKFNGIKQMVNENNMCANTYVNMYANMHTNKRPRDDMVDCENNIGECVDKVNAKKFRI